MKNNSPANTTLPPTRKYNNKLRLQKQNDLKSGIAAATAELHASRGAAATSYADIARHAGVSLPTVYSHFPDEDDLFRGCTSHVAETAPEIAFEKILAAANLATAMEMLVDAMEKQHRYYEPWSAWHMEGYVPFLAKKSVQIREHQTLAIGKILKHFLGTGKRRAMIAACETILCFDFWHRLARGHRLSRSQTRQIIIQGLLPIVGSQAASESTSRPRRKLK